MVLINDSTRNGGFESGTASPWGGISAIFDPALTHAGDLYGHVEGFRGVVYQWIPVANTDGRDFSYSFWARVPDTNGFTSLSVSFSDSDFSHTAAVTPLNVPSLSSEEWTFFSYTFSTQNAWNDSGSSQISIAFPNSPETRFAYLDSITFVQIPEPSSFSLILISMAFGYYLIRRVRFK